jgi:hypothetical protein
VPILVVATGCATYCSQTQPIGDLRVIECKYEGWIGQQRWVLAISITGCGIDIILSLNIQQECVHSLIVVENSYLLYKCLIKHIKHERKR